MRVQKRIYRCLPNVSFIVSFDYKYRSDKYKHCIIFFQAQLKQFHRIFLVRTMQKYSAYL